MESKTPKDEYTDILKENLRLKAELNLLKGKQKARTALGRVASKITTNIFVGKGLKYSVLRLFDEIPEGKVSKVTLADVSSHVVWRLTRVGMFTLLLGLIPLCILAIQTYILDSQNDLLKAQNRRLDQQINLEEGQRRSSLIFLMSNIMDKMGEELKAPNNRRNMLSDALIGRIVSLSQALRPYRYLENDHLIQQPLSPERGQLLISLTNSNLHESTYEQIFERADFSYADLYHANFDGNYMNGIDLSHANLKGASFRNTILEFANLEGANLEDVEFESTYMNSIKLNGANLKNSHLHNVKMRNGNLKEADFRNAQISGDFRFSNIDGIRLDSIKIGVLDLEGIEIRNPKIMALVDTNDVASIFTLPLASRDYLNDNFKWEPKAVQKEDMSISSSFVIVRKKASNLFTMENCLKRVLAVIKSSNHIQKLEEELSETKEVLTLLPEANPFGDNNLDLAMDSVYLFRMISAGENTPLAIGWVEFDPSQKTLKEYSLGDTTSLTFNESLLRQFPLECKN
ncbi:MAG: pentapeptide repeat-containing protein [Bacteroidota bacterium]